MTKLQQKEREFEVLTQEMFKRSKSKFHEIDVLKKQLAEAERNLSRSIGKANFFIYSGVNFFPTEFPMV